MAGGRVAPLSGGFASRAVTSSVGAALHERLPRALGAALQERISAGSAPGRLLRGYEIDRPERRHAQSHRIGMAPPGHALGLHPTEIADAGSSVLGRVRIEDLIPRASARQAD